MVSGEMAEEKKNLTVNTAQLEEAFGVDLKEFEEGKTYLMAKLFDALGLLKGHYNIPPGVMR